MLEPVYAYVVAISMLLICAGCALALFTAIDHFDSPESREAPKDRREPISV